MIGRRFFRRRDADAELQEEMDVHVAAEIEENLARGYSEEQARRAALLKFGNVQQVRERVWRQNTISWLDSVGRDLKFGARSLRRSPGFAVVAMVVIALGIGVNAALFTVVRSVLLRPLPFKEPQGLVRLYENTNAGQVSFPFNNCAAGVFAVWQKENHNFTGMALNIIGGATTSQARRDSCRRRCRLQISHGTCCRCWAWNRRWGATSHRPTTGLPPTGR